MNKHEIVKTLVISSAAVVLAFSSFSDHMKMKSPEESLSLKPVEQEMLQTKNNSAQQKVPGWIKAAHRDGAAIEANLKKHASVQKKVPGWISAGHRDDAAIEANLKKHVERPTVAKISLQGRAPAPGG